MLDNNNHLIDYNLHLMIQYNLKKNSCVLARHGVGFLQLLVEFYPYKI